MSVIKQTGFSVGDVVEDKSGLRGMIYTTERTEGLKQAGTVFSEICASEYLRDDVFGVEWFQGKQTSFVPEDDLLLCAGMTYKSLCYECKDRFACWTARR